MFETEFQAKHRMLAERFANIDLDAHIARERAKALAGVAAREHDEARAAEYRKLSAEWAARAKALEAEADKANAAIAKHVGG